MEPILQISLPEPMKSFVEHQAIESGYGTASDYIRSLIDADQRRSSGEALEAMLRHGLNRADLAPMSDADWEAYQLEFRERRLAALRREVEVGLADLARGDALPADEVFRRLRERNQDATNRAK
jgi:putative addiction module CopG family antidote